MTKFDVLACGQHLNFVNLKLIRSLRGLQFGRMIKYGQTLTASVYTAATLQPVTSAVTRYADRPWHT